MISIETLDHLFSDNELQFIEDIVSSEVENFSDLYKRLSLDPSSDFVNSNLEGVDFSNSDLRGFNFSGSDLSNSFGVNITWDASTNFESADLTESAFSCYAYSKEIFEKNPNLNKTLGSLLNEGPYKASSWIFENINRDGSNFEENKAIALRLFDETDDATKRISIFYAAKSLFENSTEYREFLLSVFARNSDDRTVVLNCLHVLASVYYYDSFSKKIFSHFLRESQWPNVQEVAFRGLKNGSSDETERKRLVEEVYSEEFSSLRREMVQKRIGTKKNRYGAIFDPRRDTDEIIDFAYTIDSELLTSLVTRNAMQQARANLFQLGLSSSQIERSSERVAPTEELRQRGFQKVRAAFIGLFADTGIKFRFTQETASQLVGDPNGTFVMKDGRKFLTKLVFDNEDWI